MPAHTISEDWSALMGRAQDGDLRAYTLLLRAILPYLRSLVRRRLADAAEIDEVVQDILLTLHRIRPTYDPARPLAPWLAAIARRRLVDRLRFNSQHARRKRALTEALMIAPEIDPLRDPDVYLRLYSAIGALPDGQRQAIQLLKLHQMSLKEAAAATGLSIGALKVSSHRGVKRLQQAMGAA
jgi:RNA polymerase sigma-70 factor (ECF subfamily)